MLKMLSLGRTDAVVINKLVALWVIKNDDQLQPSGFVFAPKIVDSAGYRIMFTRKHDWASFVDSFNSILNAMKKDGHVDKIISHYQ